MDKLSSLNIGYFFLIGAIIAALIHLSKLDTQQQIKTKIEAAKGQVATEESQLKSAQSLEQEKPKQEAEIQAKTEIFQTALDTMPSVTNHREILEAVSNEAKMAGVRIIQLRPKDMPMVKEIKNVKKLKDKENVESSNSFYDETTYDIELESSYTQLTYLFYLLTKIKPNLGFKNINVIKKDFLEGVALLNFKAVLVAYRYKEPAAKSAAVSNGKPKAAPQGVKK